MFRISATPESSSDERITLKILGDWVEQNEKMRSMFGKFEPEKTLKERDSLFLPFKRDNSHLPILLNKYLGKKLAIEKPNDKQFSGNSNFIKRASNESIKSSSKKVGKSIAFTKNIQFKEEERKSQKKILLQRRVRKSIRVPLSIERLADPGFDILKRNTNNRLSLPNLAVTERNDNSRGGNVLDSKAKTKLKKKRKSQSQSKFKTYDYLANENQTERKQMTIEERK